MNDTKIKVTLTVVKGPDRGKTCELQSGEEIVGRGSPGLHLTDSNISQKHFKLSIQGSEVWVEDVGSRNGTIVGEKKIDRVRVENLDEIKVGKSVLKVFVLEDLDALRSQTRKIDKGENTSPKTIKDLISDELKRFSKWDLNDDAKSEVDEGELHIDPYLLRIVDSNGEEFEIRVRKAMIMLGRTKTDVEINDPDISRLHATLEYEGPGRIRVKDMSSTNGTFVNGKKIKDVLLKNHDQIQVGSSYIEFITLDK